MAVSRNVIVANQEGLHLRAVTVLVRTARQFASTKVELVRDGLRVECTDTLRLLTIGAEQGAEFRIEADGPDAQAAVDVVAGLFETNFGEN